MALTPGSLASGSAEVADAAVVSDLRRVVGLVREHPQLYGRLARNLREHLATAVRVEVRGIRRADTTAVRTVLAARVREPNSVALVLVVRGNQLHRPSHEVELQVLSTGFELVRIERAVQHAERVDLREELTPALVADVHDERDIGPAT